MPNHPQRLVVLYSTSRRGERKVAVKGRSKFMYRQQIELSVNWNMEHIGELKICSKEDGARMRGYSAPPPHSHSVNRQRHSPPPLLLSAAAAPAAATGCTEFVTLPFLASVHFVVRFFLLRTKTMSEQKQLSNEVPEEDVIASDGNNPELKEDEAESDRSHSSGNGDKTEYVVIKLSDVRKEVQCPICLGIIRKTRTVMECLHRFCRECIDKSMRLGNNECPTCRTHCASRRSLRDDPNYDALIALLYPDIDKYEEEELALQEDEVTHNKLKIQDSIARTSRRQTEAFGKKRSAKATAMPFVRTSQGSYRTSPLRRRNFRNGGELQVSNGNEDMNDNDGEKGSSSDDEQTKRAKRGAETQFPQHSATTDADGAGDENIPELNREIMNSSGSLAWGKNGHRSPTRVMGKNARNSHVSKLADLLRNSEINDDELDVNLMIVSLDEQSIPSLELSYLCCKPTMSVRLLCQHVALKTSVQVDEVELLLVKEPQASIINGKRPVDPDKDKLLVLGEQETLAELLKTTDNICCGHLVMSYRRRLQKSDTVEMS